MKEIFLLLDKNLSSLTQEVIVLLIEYNDAYKLRNGNLNLEFKNEKLKDLGYFAKVSNVHNQYKDIPVRSGNLCISNSELDIFINEPGLNLIDTLGKAKFTEDSANFSSLVNITIIDTNNYVPIDAKVGVLLRLNISQDFELDNSNICETLGFSA